MAKERSEEIAKRQREAQIAWHAKRRAEGRASNASKNRPAKRTPKEAK